MSVPSADDEFPHEASYREIDDAARPEAVQQQHRRGKLTARGRIAQLTDPATFRELGGLARPEELGADGRPIHADSVITGTAEIDGRPVVVLASDFTAAGGSNGALGNEKYRRCWELAASRGFPVVMLFDGGGHRIQEGLDAREFAGGFDIMELQTRLSGWVPLVAAILGPGYGQPTLLAALCDYVVAVRGIATMGMAPPALVRAAIGEDVDAEALGGADAQASFGTIDLAVDSEPEALDSIRRYLACMPSNALADVPMETPAGPEPQAATALDRVVPVEFRRGYDMHDVIAGMVDEDSVVELKAAFAGNMITALARIEGRMIGIIGNQPRVRAGVLDSGASEKAAHLVSLCDAFGIPVLVLMDLPGLGVGSVAERSGLARRSARLVQELGSATVPKFTVVVRKGYGGGYVVMSGGRTFHPELCVAWPYAETAAMAVETAVEVAYRRDIESADDPESRRAELYAKFRSQLGAVRAAEGFGVDVVVKPSETRAMLADTMRHLPRHRLMETSTPRRHPVSPM